MRMVYLAAGLLAWVAVAAAQDQPPKSIACKDKGSYTGNFISPKFTLAINGDREKTWEYTYEDDFSGTMPLEKMRVAGTWEIRNGMAVFTGKATGTGRGEKKDGAELRLGLNFGVVKGQVTFNRFFPTVGGKFVYQRQWFKRVNGVWHLEEERSFTLTAGPPDGKVWKVHLVGTRVLPALGPKGIETFGGEYTYRKGAGMEWNVKGDRPRPWFPTTLVPELVEGRIAAVRINYPGIGELRGFTPYLAQREQ